MCMHTLQYTLTSAPSQFLSVDTTYSIRVDASCCYYPCDLQAIKARKCVLTDTSPAEMFYQEK